MSASATEREVKDESHELLEKWSNRWKANQLGWHIEEPHPTLVEQLPSVLQHIKSNNSGNTSVLVPLCGKTVDLAYLADHPSIDNVVGVEGIAKAIEEFSQEHPSLKISKAVDNKQHKSFDVYLGNKISLLKGNFFDLDVSSLPVEEAGGKFDIVWDRASIVAIDPSLRSDYVNTIRRVLKPGGVILLASFDRREGNDEAMAAGPPFSVNEATVRELYESQSWVEKVVFLNEKNDMEDENRGPRWIQAGLTQVFETFFAVYTKKEETTPEL